MPILGSGVAGIEPETAVAALADAIDARQWELSPPKLTVVAFLDAHVTAAIKTLANRQASSETLEQILDAAEAVLSPELVERLRGALTTLAGDPHKETPHAPLQFFEAALEALTLAGGGQTASMEFRPVGDLLEQAIEGHRASGHPIDRVLIALCTAGVDARNRLVRRPWTDADEERSLRRDLINAAAGILQFLAGKTLGSPSSSPRTAGAASDGTSHVRNLHQLLRSELTQAQLDNLLRWLLDNDYVGEPDMRLLDYCVNTSPIDILLKVFSGDDLDRLLSARVHAVERGADAQTRAQRLAEALGYPAQREPRGVLSVRRQVLQARAECDIAGEHELTGAVARCSSSVEALLRTYLGFLSHAAFGDPAERWAHRANHLKQHETVAKASLGKLLRLITELQGDIEAGVAPRAGEFRRDFQTVQLIPSGLGQTLVPPRNRLVHGTPEEHPLALAELRKMAKEFYDQADRLLQFLDDPSNPLYPRVVVISRVETDRWGRRIAVAEGEDGEPHRIFTDQELLPAQTYLMRPLTNPIRVDPILIPVEPGR